MSTKKILEGLSNHPPTKIVLQLWVNSWVFHQNRIIRSSIKLILHETVRSKRSWEYAYGKKQAWTLSLIIIKIVLYSWVIFLISYTIHNTILTRKIDSRISKGPKMLKNGWLRFFNHSLRIWKISLVIKNQNI